MEMPIKQGATIIAKAAFQFKVTGSRGRAVSVKPGQRFWVTNCGTDQVSSGLVTIDLEGRGYISHGYAFRPETLAQCFELELA